MYLANPGSGFRPSATSNRTRAECCPRTPSKTGRCVAVLFNDDLLCLVVANLFFIQNSKYLRPARKKHLFMFKYNGTNFIMFFN